MSSEPNVLTYREFLEQRLSDDKKEMNLRKTDSADYSYWKGRVWALREVIATLDGCTIERSESAGGDIKVEAAQ